MKISEIMAREFETVAAEATIEGAAQIMAELDVVALPVHDHEGVVGMLTERDITEAANKHIDPSRLATVIVGDRDRAVPELERLGLGELMVDAPPD